MENVSTWPQQIRTDTTGMHGVAMEIMKPSSISNKQEMPSQHNTTTDHGIVMYATTILLSTTTGRFYKTTKLRYGYIEILPRSTKLHPTTLHVAPYNAARSAGPSEQRLVTMHMDNRQLGNKTLTTGCRCAMTCILHGNSSLNT